MKAARHGENDISHFVYPSLDGHLNWFLFLVSVSHSVTSDSVTWWTVALQAPLSMGFSRQEYWSGLPFPSPVNLPDPRIEPGSPALQADFLPTEPPGKSKNTELGSRSLLQGILPTQE